MIDTTTEDMILIIMIVIMTDKANTVDLLLLLDQNDMKSSKGQKQNETKRLVCMLETCLILLENQMVFLVDVVQEMFEKCGRLASVNVPIDRVTGRNKGY
jgi:hypothetical protein